MEAFVFLVAAIQLAVVVYVVVLLSRMTAALTAIANSLYAIERQNGRSVKSDGDIE